VVGEAGDGRAALELVARLQPDLLICDLSMPGLHGLEVTRQSRTVCAGTRVIVLSVHAEEPYLVQALGFGASGYVLKCSSSEHLLGAIRAALNGERYVSPPFAPTLLH
jgi:DNA-binding NarL/FixJ family response regulator